MVVKLICLVIVNLFLFFNGVKSDSFADIANDLNAKFRQNDDTNAVYKEGANAYAKKFIAFLKSYNDETNSEIFENMEDRAWAGHYLMKVYADENLANEMALNGTAFQTNNNGYLKMKNTYILRNVYSFLSHWVVDMMGDSSKKKCKTPITLGKLQIDKVREHYRQALHMIADTHDSQDRMKRMEVALIYFYDIAKRVAGTKNFIEDPIISTEYQRLVNSRITDAETVAAPAIGPSPSKKMSIPFTKKKVPIPKAIVKNPDEFTKYVKNKVKEIKGKSFGDVMPKYYAISTEIINLFYYIFKYAPEKFTVDPFDDVLRMFRGNYLHTSKHGENNFAIIDSAHTILMQIFGPRKVKYIPDPVRRNDNEDGYSSYY